MISLYFTYCYMIVLLTHFLFLVWKIYLKTVWTSLPVSSFPCTSKTMFTKNYPFTTFSLYQKIVLLVINSLFKKNKSKLLLFWDIKTTTKYGTMIFYSESSFAAFWMWTDKRRKLLKNLRFKNSYFASSLVRTLLKVGSALNNFYETT